MAKGKFVLDPKWAPEIEKCCEILKKGGLILYPTDTIWGIGCDGRNEDAVKKVYDLKQRVDSKSMIVLLDRDARLHQFVTDVPEVAWDVLDAAERPMTIIYPAAKGLPDNLVAKDGSIAIRIPKPSFCNALVHKFRHPIVSTSANISGEPSPKRFGDIDRRIFDGVDYIVNLDHDKQGGKSSSILKIALNGEIEIIRD